MRTFAKSLATVAAVAGALLGTAGPAQAAQAQIAQAQAAPAAPVVKSWQSVSTGPTWNCARTVVHKAKADVGFQACLVRNDNHDAQVVLVVVNNSASPVTISGTVTEAFGADAKCDTRTLAVGERRGCFGFTGAVPECLFGPGIPDEPQYADGLVRLTVNGVAQSMRSPQTPCVDSTIPYPPF
ncbi:hypothetical protein [Streptomyces clavuligerus]|uniref:Secreted protein n=1 Tax=Streptomyces clavuligerus TaxID=1901 RepID=B5GNS7_STRCL|nr:hypothetical protein [Streptomyces clavuligerus]ANW18788.1 hypothetical protein BB341_11395 [Streptomyces clavuligerus]AXU13358.1 hypothetical protein D1794_11795 [Streptomyces clavuligerus]EDY47899.1 hypothetical protein SSCG_00927 [Streptomyces clavuligerus]EFG08528.1 Hypothetical protein SCLAV_3457 [Streptomyces clavuligerus]MBY6303313.1 hypothetical protein [Streptomyces clavuligerus]